MPKARLLVCKKTPFHSVICPLKTQEEKEVDARTWLEKYVSNVLLKQPKLNDCHCLSNSNLHKMIATEKGLLSYEDFEQL